MWRSARIFNTQEANALRPLYATDSAQKILGELVKFSNGERNDFVVDTPDNGFVTAYLDNFGDISRTRGKLTDGAKELAKSKIKTLAEIADDVRQGFYWQNLPQEVVYSGQSFEESRED